MIHPAAQVRDQWVILNGSLSLAFLHFILIHDQFLLILILNITQIYVLKSISTPWVLCLWMSAFLSFLQYLFLVIPITIHTNTPFNTLISQFSDSSSSMTLPSIYSHTPRPCHYQWEMYSIILMPNILLSYFPANASTAPRLLIHWPYLTSAIHH